MTIFVSKARLKLIGIALTAFLLGTITSPLVASTAVAPVTLQPGQQITIIAAMPSAAATVAATIAPTTAPTKAPTAAPTTAPTVAPTAAPTTASSNETMPTANLTGWKNIWADDFNTWTPSKYFVYPAGWNDTTGHGAYTPSIISASGGNLNIGIKTVNGVHEVAAFCPLLPGMVSGSNAGDLLGMRYSFRIRADALPGYKGVPLLWPLSETWPRDGEIDGPESDFTSRPEAFIHHQGGTSSSDQDGFSTPSGTTWQTWHTYVIEWVPGVRADMWIDGVQWLHDTTRVPNTPMHLVMQFETSTTSGVVPSASTSGQVQIAWLSAWAMA